MAVAAMKHMASNFAKLDKFERVDFRRWQKKMHFMLSSMSVVYVLTTPIPEDGENASVEQIRKRAKYTDNRGKRKHHDNTKADPNKKPKVTCWKCGKPEHLKKDFKDEKVYYVTYVSEAYIVHDDDVAWWVDSGATLHVCKDRCWFKTYDSMNDGSILHRGNESTTLVHGRGCVDLRFSSGKIVSLFNVLHVPNIRKNLVSSSILNNCGYKQVIESNKFILSKHGVFIGFGYLSNQMFKINIIDDNIGTTFMSTSNLNDSNLWHARLGHVQYKRMQDMSKDGLIPAFDMDTEKCKTCMMTKITKKPFQNVKCETEVLELIHNDLCDRHATSSLGNKKYFVTFIDDASSSVVRLHDPKLKTLGKRGIECIFVGYAEHSKTFRFCSISRPSLRIPNRTEDIGDSVVPEEVAEEEQGMSNDEMDSIMGNNIWVLADLPPGCKPFGCKWIFKRKLKVDGTIEKFKARLVIQGCRQNVHRIRSSRTRSSRTRSSRTHSFSEFAAPKLVVLRICSSRTRSFSEFTAPELAAPELAALELVVS
ncbi:zinc finger, CCHC-type containing protein [Tanacetum coccineum]|uniref:Zinc finger, CCHC-type containing protein n=1 Tax=Tanacetum coccineum TaxID=301880 RepID=A0ABQ5AL59_9ASTR